MTRESFNRSDLYTAIIVACCMLFGIHTTLSDFDSYLYLSTIKEGYINGLGLGRVMFTKPLSMVYLFSPEFIKSNYELILRLFSFISTTVALTLFANFLFPEKAKIPWTKFIFASLAATMIPIGFYGSEILLEPFFLLILALLITITLRKDSILIFLALGLGVHVREQLLLFFPLLLALMNKHFPLTVSKLYKSVLMLIIGILTPTIYLITKKGKIYFSTIESAIASTFQSSPSISAVIITTLMISLLTYFLARYRKRVSRDHFHNILILLFATLPDLTYVLTGTTPISTHPRYYVAWSIILAFLLTKVIARFRSRAPKRATLFAIVLITTNIGFLAMFSSTKASKAEANAKYNRELVPHLQTLIIGLRGIELRATTTDETICFNVISSGWNWPGQNLHKEVLKNLSKGFEILIDRKYLMPYEVLDIELLLRTIDRSKINVQQSGTRVKLSRKRSFPLNKKLKQTTPTPYCWE